MDYQIVVGDSATQRGPYKMSAVSRLTDFSPALLRAWERRHKLLQPMRGPGGHRLYSEEDLQFLLQVRELIQEGRSIGEIASMGRGSLLRRNEAFAEPTPPMSLELEPADPKMKAEIERYRSLIVQAAVTMSSGALNRALDAASARVPAQTVIFDVMTPTAIQLGELRAAGRCTAASERLASGHFAHRLRNLIETTAPMNPRSPLVIVACLPDEYHQLGALAVAYLMIQAGARVSFLGPALPLEDLENACKVLMPCVALLSVTRQTVYQVHRRRLVETAARLHGRQRVFVGGMGAPRADIFLERAGGTIVPPDMDLSAALRPIISVVHEAPRRRLH